MPLLHIAFHPPAGWQRAQARASTFSLQKTERLRGPLTSHSKQGSGKGRPGPGELVLRRRGMESEGHLLPRWGGLGGQVPCCWGQGGFGGGAGTEAHVCGGPTPAPASSPSSPSHSPRSPQIRYPPLPRLIEFRFDVEALFHRAI